MSVTVHDARGAAEHSRHQRLVVVAAVVATLAVIAGPALAAALGVVGHGGRDRDPTLTTAAQRVLEKAPGAFETGGIVVIPASANRGILWTGAISPDLVVAPVIDLGVRGLAQPGYLPSGGKVPGWLANVGTADQVYDDVGNLTFACTRWPGVANCKGTLLIEHAGERYIFRSGLDLVQSPPTISTFLVLDEGRPRELVLGGAPPRAARVVVTLADGVHTVEAHATAAGAVDGATLWWVSVTDPISAVTFLGADGAVLAKTTQ